MEVSSSNLLIPENEETALKNLLDAFGSMFTLKEIAHAYCDAGRNVDLAGQLLFDKQGSVSVSSNLSNGEARTNEISEPSHVNNCEDARQGNGKLRASKTKLRPVSGGTVSCFLGKDYVKPTQPASGSCMTNKPFKLDRKELPMSELWGEEAKLTPKKDDYLHKDMEDFLFNMLGNGFQLNRDVVREVLDNCGYDMQKSMSKLLDQPALNADRKTMLIGKSTEKSTETCSSSEGLLRERKLQQGSPREGGCEDSNSNGAGLPRQLKEKNELQKEILATLFTTPEMIEEELPRKIVRTARRSKAFGQPVTEPLRDYVPERSTYTVQLQLDDINDEDEEGDYQLLRKAVMEYRATMKEYYRAAIDAFAKKDHVQASKFMEQGHFFREKARESDEESRQKIFETKHDLTQTDMHLDLHEHSAKEAVRLLKCHISSLAGISSFKDLKVVLETGDEDSSKGARRRWVMKLLDKESIQWTPEEENAGTIIIPLNKIDPNRLTFSKK